MISTVGNALPELRTSDKSSDGISPDEKRSPVDFDSLLSDSNAFKRAELEKEKAMVGDGSEIKIGETKTDKEFRDMLEKVTGKKQDKLKNKLEKDDYLNLMVTQLKYQDPTKPMENSEMATQLAQFNTVEQLINTNKILGELKAGQSSANADKLTQYIGKSVMVNGNNLKIEAGKLAANAQFDLPSPAGTANIQIKDTAGSVIKTIDMGTLEAGTHKINWDGTDEKGQKVAPGSYTFNIVANTTDGKAISSRNSYFAKVIGVSDISNGGKLDTSAGTVELKDVSSVRALDDSTTSPVDLAKIANAPQPAAPVDIAKIANALNSTAPEVSRPAPKIPPRPQKNESTSKADANA